MNAYLLVISIFVSMLAIGLSTWAIVSQKRLNQLSKSFLQGRTGADLEGLLLSLSGEMKNLAGEQLFFHESLKTLQDKLSFSIQKIGVVRFNPFSDSGGNFSFSLALLDQQNNGILLTSMHGREQNRIYCKNISKGKSEIKLTSEEELALNKATANN